MHFTDIINTGIVVFFHDLRIYLFYQNVNMEHLSL